MTTSNEAPDRSTGDRHRGSEDRGDLRRLFGESIAAFASLAGPAHVLESANSAFFDAIGGDARRRTGIAIADLVPELTEQGLIALLDSVYRTGRAHTERDARILLGPAGDVRERYFDFTYEPRRDSGGNVTGVTVVGVDLTQVKHAQRLAAEHRALLEQIARDAPVHQVLDGMARAIEELSPGVLVSVLLADTDGRHLRHGAAPSLPAFYNDAIDGIATGEGVGSCGTAAHRREPVIVTDIATHPYWDDFRDLAAKASLAACWSTPIMARDGELLGTFAMYHRSPRAPQEADLALSAVFAGTAALAVERHRAEVARSAAEASEKAARDGLAFLLDAGTAVSQDLDFTQSLQRLARLCVPALAPLCAIDVVHEGRLRRIATAGVDATGEQLLASHSTVYDDADDVVARVLASGTTEVARRAPTGPGPWSDLAVTGYLCVPLLDRGRPFGTLTLLTNGRNPIDGHTVALAEELTRRASLAARNARQYTARVQLSRDLQAGLLLPDPPDVPGARIVTHYRPAGEGLEVGGDFYDVFPIADGRWAFLIGDVCGRGALAATTTALVRHTARAVARLVPDPPAVVSAVNTALLERPRSHGTGFVTLVYGELRRAGDGLAVSFVRAGHVAPLHLAVDAQVDEVQVDGMLLGVDAGVRFKAAHLRLQPGESLVLVTDGITEARSEYGVLFGEQRLAEAVAAARPGAGADAVLDSLVSAVRAFTDTAAEDDDQAVLVITAE
ncbi:SpoIIE family protein phosphatase [Kitasatospora sp. NBC_01287]|uniref:GAF domain-containing SpoIIE family protein phosphatase n=1 Tax=Kitasatospora sp. NBC_01287 TaxID=2903573 RepID=UPI0022551440|nr:GAF domain-containing SpoIIE family protein phosphatase [Kitasatospora sp. NBC_01287]MCX4751047.1 SpoIIE family protein phosphatase [Kitasatospora sp. NBC_01287]